MDAIKSIEKLRSPSDIVMYCGDWNMPVINWMESDDETHFIPLIGESQSMVANIANYVTNEMIEMGLLQIGNFKNNKGNVLDLFFSNMPELCCIEKASINLIPNDVSDKAHTQALCTIECQPKAFLPNTFQSSHYCFKKADYQAIRDKLQAYFNAQVWEVEDFDDINEMVKLFYDIIHSIFDECVPRSSIKFTKRPVWFDNQLTKL